MASWLILKDNWKNNGVKLLLIDCEIRGAFLCCGLAYFEKFITQNNAIVYTDIKEEIKIIIPDEYLNLTTFQVTLNMEFTLCR